MKLFPFPKSVLDSRGQVREGECAVSRLLTAGAQIVLMLVVATTCSNAVALAMAEPEISVVEPGGGLVAKAFYPADGKAHSAVLLLGGSGGGIGWQVQQAELLAKRGYAALALAYFGMEGLPMELERIPLEYFDHALTWLRLQPFVASDRIGVVGVSKGGELALVLASRRPEIRAVVAFVPSAVVFQSVADGWPQSSSWSLGGQELPYVAYGSVPSPKNIADLYRAGVDQTAVLEQATIPVERIAGPILLLSGQDDNLWPSTMLSDMAMKRLKKNDFRFAYEHVAYPDAGHLISTVRAEDVSRRGGTEEGNRKAQYNAQERMFAFLQSHLRP